MSRHTMILADHDLDTTWTESIACDLAHRFGGRVVYGMVGLPRQLERLGIHLPKCLDPTDHFIQLGSPLAGREGLTYRLEEEFGTQRRLYERFGAHIFRDPAYLGWDDGFVLSDLPSLVESEVRDPSRRIEAFVDDHRDLEEMG